MFVAKELKSRLSENLHVLSHLQPCLPEQKEKNQSVKIVTPGNSLEYSITCVTADINLSHEIKTCSGIKR